MMDGAVIKAFPISNAEDFSRSPDLLSTVCSENAYLTDDVISANKWTFDLTAAIDEDKIAILMATDALAAWVMVSDTDARLNALFEITEQDRFAELVRQARSNGTLKTDDTTMITIRISRDLPAKY